MDSCNLSVVGMVGRGRRDRWQRALVFVFDIFDLTIGRPYGCGSKPGKPMSQCPLVPWLLGSSLFGWSRPTAIDRATKPPGAGFRPTSPHPGPVLTSRGRRSLRRFRCRGDARSRVLRFSCAPIGFGGSPEKKDRESNWLPLAPLCALLGGGKKGLPSIIHLSSSAGDACLERNT